MSELSGFYLYQYLSESNDKARDHGMPTSQAMHPYCLEACIRGRENYRYILSRVIEQIELCIATDMHDLLLGRSVCGRCGSVPIVLSDHFACGSENTLRNRLEFLIDKIHAEEVEVVNKKHHQRRRTFERMQRVAEVGGSYTKSELRQQYEQQGGYCFYCYKVLRNPEGDFSAHAEHYTPVSLGGSNAIDNIVISCPRCNHRKSTADGGVFREKMYKEATAEIKPLLKAMQRRKKTL